MVKYFILYTSVFSFSDVYTAMHLSSTGKSQVRERGCTLTTVIRCRILYTLITFDLVTELDLIIEFDFFTKLPESSIWHLQIVMFANRGRLLLRTPWSCPILRMCICSKFETSLPKMCHGFRL